MSPETLHNIWSGFPYKPYQLSLFYLLTPVLLPSGRPRDADLVLDVETDYRVAEPAS